MKENKPCGKSCKGKILNGDKGIYCKHIEDKLPKPTNQSVKAFAYGRIEDLWLKIAFREARVPEEVIVERLKQAGLGVYEIELLMLRYVEGKSMKTIVAEQGWLNKDSASHFLRKALSSLRKVGFTLS
jgi:hypothetical protein